MPGCVGTLLVLRPAEGAAELAREVTLAAALPLADASAVLGGGPPVPGAVIAAGPWVPVLDVTDVRAPCVRNGIIA